MNLLKPLSRLEDTRKKNVEASGPGRWSWGRHETLIKSRRDGWWFSRMASRPCSSRPCGT